MSNTDRELLTARPSRTLPDRLRRSTDGFFDGMGMRPFGILMFVASSLLLLQLVGLSSGPVRADAVAAAGWIDHPARTASFVAEVFVRPGERVAVGTPLVRLSPHFLDQRIARVDSRIEETRNEAQLAEAELQVVEQRWVTSSARVRPGRPSLRLPTAAVYARQVEVLETRKNALLDDRTSLLIRSTSDGLVAQVARLGAAVEEAGSVASVTSEVAEEIVAYVPAATPPSAISAGTEAWLVSAPARACRDAGRVIRRGAAVLEAPPQLKGPLRFPRHGLPVHISIPPGCELSVGQVVAVDFRAGVRP